MSNAKAIIAISDIVVKLNEIIALLDIGDQIEDRSAGLGEIPLIPFKDDKEFTIPQAWLNEWYQRYGEIFVRKQLVSIRNWCLDNPAKQKYSGTGKGRPKGFIGGWLDRAAKRDGRNVAAPSTAKKYARKFGGGK